MTSTPPSASPAVDAAPDPLALGPRSLIDVLDRVLDAGITVEPWVRASLASLDLAGGEARIAVASVETYLASDEPPPAPAEPVSDDAAEPDEVQAARREHDELKRAIERLDA